MSEGKRRVEMFDKLVSEVNALREECARYRSAIDRFAGLMDAVHPSYDDSVIIRCEITAGDIRALMRAKGDQDVA